MVPCKYDFKSAQKFDNSNVFCYSFDRKVECGPRSCFRFVEMHHRLREIAFLNDPGPMTCLDYPDCFATLLFTKSP